MRIFIRIFLKKKRPPAQKINIKNTMISQNRFHDQDATLLKIPDLPSRNPNRSVKLPVFHWFFPPGNLLNRLPCLVTVGCLGKIGGVFGVKQVLKTNGWSLKNPLIRPSFLEVVGILVPLNSHENKDITNTVLNFFFPRSHTKQYYRGTSRYTTIPCKKGMASNSFPIHFAPAQESAVL